MERLGVDHVPYRLYWDGSTPYSLCPDFITRETELVQAWRVMLMQKKRNETSVYQHYCNCCQALGIDVVPALNRMLVVDYLIANEDRHTGNFGLVRRADTLEWLGTAPIFDSGSSLGYQQDTPDIRTDAPIRSRPFREQPERQLALVTDFAWLDLSRLEGLAADVMAVLSESRMDEGRKTAIVEAMERRVEKLRVIIRNSSDN